MAVSTGLTLISLAVEFLFAFSAWIRCGGGRGMSWFCDVNCHLFVPSVELFILQDKLLIFNFVQQMPGKQVEMEFETLGLEP